MSKAWPRVKFGDIMRRNSRPYTLAPEEDANLVGMRLYGEGPFHRELKPAMQIAKKSHFVIKAGDVIYNKLFTWKGTFGIVPQLLDGMFVSDKFPTYELDRSRVDEDFLRLYFRCPPLWEEARTMSTGSAALSKLTLNPPKFLLLTMPLPPLTEQRRVVARIEELAAQIHQAHTLRHQSTDESEALQLHVARDLFPEPTDCTISDWIKFQTGYAFKSEWFSVSGVRLARNANVGHGRLDWSETVRLPESRRAEFPRFELQEGDILIALDRPIISTGVKVARIRKDDLPCLLLQRVARTQFQDNSVLPEYFFRWLGSSHFTNAIDPGRSNGVPHISHKDIEKIPFAAPPLPEQRRIVAALDALQAEVDALKRLQAETAAELDALLPSILDKAFKGKL
jgi:type I restriction enzyme S subunit